ncbi:ABC transporter ATP-binding protein, partial [bacterium]|nr:ABC transporter ATP-binding protein [bacterium]
FWANQDISFELNRGECLGLVGHNGAGKTTLLKMLSGLIKPDIGSIKMRGNIGSMIALGAGFNPILTGRENIIVNGAILGLSRRQVVNRMDEIVDFSDLGDFLDTPVRNYSSGMSVRLGFATAVNLIRPDVLLLDEVLAVGDAGFRSKCYAKIADLLGRTAVIFVSHNMEAVSRICDRGIFLDSGRNTHDSDATTITQVYNNSFSADQTRTISEPGYSVSGFECLPNTIKIGDDLVVQFNIESPETIMNPVIKINFTTTGGALVAEFNAQNEGLATSLRAGMNKFAFKIKNLRLMPQNYFASLTVITKRSKHLIWSRNIGELGVFGTHRGHQAYLPKGETHTGTNR